VYLTLWREKVFHSRKNSKHVLRGAPAAIHRGPRPLGRYGWKVFCCMGVVHKVNITEDSLNNEDYSCA